MKRVLPALIAAVLAASAPALAKDFVQDQAGMFGAQTVQQLNTRIGNFNAQTGKEIIVQTVPSVAGGDVRAAAMNAFAQQQVNGVLIFIDKGDRKDWIVPDRAAVQSGWWSSQTSASVASAMQAQFRAGDYDGGITTAVNATLDVYRSHLSSLPGAQPARSTNSAYPQQSAQGLHISAFWWIVIALFAFFIIRSIMRAAAGPRAYGGGYGPGGPGGPGYGGYGGYGGFGGGGGFWSGLLGGLGGAFLGNELFGRQNIGTGAWGNTDPTGGQTPVDAGGWQSDAGQADVGGGGGGDWGGGGFGGGGGDFGGGGGFGGGGDAGGGGGGW